MPLKFEDLPKELQDALYIEDCHLSGEHNPDHTSKHVCNYQLADMAKRIFKALDIDISDPKRDLTAESNKIPRRLKPNGWAEYYKTKRPAEYERLMEWEKNGYKKG